MLGRCILLPCHGPVRHVCLGRQVIMRSDGSCLCSVTPRFQMSLMLDIAVFDKKRFSKVRVGECRIQLGQLVPYVEVRSSTLGFAPVVPA